MDECSAERQIKESVRAFGKVPEIGFIVSGRLGNCVRWVYKVPSANRREVVGFAETFVELGLVLILRLGEG